MSDVLDRTQRDIATRLKELQPLVDEAKRLEAATAALKALGGSTPTAATRRVTTPAPAKSPAPKPRKRRGGRPRASKNRAKAAPASAPTVATPAAAVATAAPPVAGPAAESSPGTKRRRRVARGKAGARKRKLAPLSANQQAIVAALEHGAHTVRELVVVTSMSDQTARNNLKVLVTRDTVVKTERGGTAAYALPASLAT